MANILQRACARLPLAGWLRLALSGQARPAREKAHFDAVTIESSVAPSGRPSELRPAKAIASIPIANIELRTAFALSQKAAPARCSYLRQPTRSRYPFFHRAA